MAQWRRLLLAIDDILFGEHIAGGVLFGLIGKELDLRLTLPVMPLPHGDWRALRLALHRVIIDRDGRKLPPRLRSQLGLKLFATLANEAREGLLFVQIGAGINALVVGDLAVTFGRLIARGDQPVLVD